MSHPVGVVEVEPSPDATWKVGLCSGIASSAGAEKERETDTHTVSSDCNQVNRHKRGMLETSRATCTRNASNEQSHLYEECQKRAEPLVCNSFCRIHVCSALGPSETYSACTRSMTFVQSSDVTHSNIKHETAAESSRSVAHNNRMHVYTGSEQDILCLHQERAQEKRLLFSSVTCSGRI